MAIKKILVVDDEEPIYTYLQKKLSKVGFNVFLATDGEAALAQAFNNLPDIILLDVKLPKLNGIEVCKRLKAGERTKDIPILILSAKTQFKEIEEGLQAGASKYLCKPISFPDLLKEITALGESGGSSLEKR
jgi:two-component system phosphate regulon response regulator PhoB